MPINLAMTDFKNRDPIVEEMSATMTDSKGREVLEDELLQRIITNKRRSTSWRKTVGLGATTASLVLLVNIGVLAWVKHTYVENAGIATVFEGSCDVSRKATVYADLAINILSTLLLGASNNCAQLLSAPTRTEVDAAHHRGKWLDIGVASLRNLAVIPAWRTALWVILFMSSLPLHLLYNSAVFTTFSAIDYQAALVTEDFVQGGWWNQSRAIDLDPSPNMGQLQQIQEHISELKRLENKECIEAYGTSMTESQWRNVLLVTSLRINDSLLAVYSHSPDNYDGNDLGWVCDGGFDYWSAGSPSCDIKSLLVGATDWTLYNVPTDWCENVTLADGSFQTYAPCHNYTAPIEYCLAEPFPPHCRIRISTSILSIVVVCNLLKVICMIITISSPFVPLANLGDAIASFLDQTDETTKEYGPISVKDIKNGAVNTSPRAYDFQSRPYTRGVRFWGGSTSVTRWIICLLLCCIAWGAALALLFEGKSTQLAETSKSGIGSFSSLAESNVIDVGSLVGISEGSPLIANVLLANLPQMAISLVYVFYNNVLTCMLLAREWALFAKNRKPLRVTQPRGEQRSTYWLQLPYRYILPLMATMAVLHWLISRSIFLVQLDIYDNNGVLVPGRRINACGYSLPAITLALAVGGVLIMALVICSFRRLEDGIPVVGSCSLAISAACSNNEEEEPSLRRLQYGVLVDHPADRHGRQYAGFSCSEVGPLVSGVAYR